MRWWKMDLHIEAKVLDERLFDYGISRGTGNSAGIDLRAMLQDRDKITMWPGKTVLIPTGLSIYIADNNYAGFIMARSGLASKKGLAPANKVGLIDADYQGPLMVALHNHSDEAQIVELGERIAQLVILPVCHYHFEFVNKFYNETERGEGGFGSTGTH